jgi:hypothetical protein
MHRSASRAARMLIVTGTVVAVTAVAAPPAAAATATVTTAAWDWLDVHDTTLGVSDAVAYHRDALGSGVDLKGWTEDAFDAYESVDGYLSSVGFDHADPLLSGYLIPTPVSFDVHPAGGATIVSEVVDYDLGGGASLDATFTLEIAGSFARWTIEIDDGGSGLVESVWGSGELGSPTAAAPVGGDGLVVTGPSGLGPVIGFHVESDGVSDAMDGSDPEFPGFTSVGASTIAFTIALLDYDPCAEADAVAVMTALVPDLEAHLGEDLEPVLSDCVDIASAAQLQLGSPTDQLLELTLSDELAGGHSRLDGQSYFDYVDDWTSGLGVLAPDLPAGLDLEVVQHPVTMLPALRLSGMPIVAFSGDVPVRLYGIRQNQPFAGEMPLAATLALDIDSLDLAAPGDDDPPGGELAESGSDAPLAFLASAVAFAAGAWLIAADRRRARRAAE